jgi:hypothetical protein
MVDGKIKYTCSCCGKVHEEWPALAYDSPTSYNVLSEKVKSEIGELSSDFCIVRHPEQIDRFIRGNLTLHVIDHCENLEYGLWVSLSEISFENYSAYFNNPNHETQYFGWLSNDIPDYNIIKDIPTTVYTRLGNQRPEIIPHKDFDHPLVYDYYNGITKAEAEKRIREMLEAIRKKNSLRSKLNSFWKFRK